MHSICNNCTCIAASASYAGLPACSLSHFNKSIFLDVDQWEYFKCNYFEVTEQIDECY
jgi:hypothetical protein